MRYLINLRAAPIILFLYLICSVQLLRSQPHYFRSYGVKEGMSGNAVISMLQDRKGFMWFGTRNGLNRFDGSSFKIFRNDPLDSLSIGSNSIGYLSEDGSGRLWIGTHKGIYIYDAKKEIFRPFKRLPQIMIRGILHDKKGNTWIIAGFELYRYNEGRNELQHYSFHNEPSNSISLSAAGELWVGSNQGIVKKYDHSTNSFTSYRFTASLPVNERVGNIRDLLPLSDSTVLVGLVNKVLLFNTRSNDIKNVFDKYRWAEDLKVRCIFPRSDSVFWVGTESGVYSIDLNSGSAERIYKEANNPYSLTDDVIFSIYKDVEGGTWLGTFYGGANYYSEKFNRFHKYFHEEGHNVGFKGSVVHEITTDKNGYLWVGTEDAGLNKIDERTGTVRHFKADDRDGSISYDKIHGLVAAGNELWIGTLERGLDVMDLRTEKVVRHYNAGNDSNSLKSNFIVSLYRRRNGEILVGTSRGLFRYNRKTDNFSLIPSFTMQIQAMHEDAEGTLWVCSYGQGVYYYNDATGKKGSIRHIPGNMGSLINDYVNNIFEDKANNFWFCTEEGLSRFDPLTGRITNYTTTNGLPDNQVFRVLEDDLGSIWVSTAHGLAQLNQQTGVVRKYGTADGLICEQFNYNSAFKKGSTLYFGTVKGMISFDPGKFVKSSFIPPLVISDIRINNREIRAYDPNARIKNSITFSDDIELPYDYSDLSLDVAALSFAAPEKNEYMYKMEGLDTDWTHIQSNRKIFYTKLPPGEYVFRVKGSNSDGLWNPKETTLAITITPPWWTSTLAFIAYALIASGIALTIIIYYHIAMKERARRRMEAFEMKKEREMYHAKIDFFTNVTHEIKTPLTLIKLPVEQLLNTYFEDPEIKENIHMINRNTNRLIDLSDQLLDFRKAEANHYHLTFVETNLSSVLREEYMNFKPVAEQKGLAFSLNLCRIEPMACIDPEAFRKILTNLFTNAIKYAKSTVIIKLLPFGSDDKDLCIEFMNDGHLIPAESEEKIFEPFYRLKETEDQSGTGIGLPFARSLAELHNGSLKLSSSKDGFNTFLLTLPIEQEEKSVLPLLQTGSVFTDEAAQQAADELIDLQKPSILLVEDNSEIINFLKKTLRTKYRVLQALNGRLALEVLETENVSLIITDIMMPEMDGIELCRRMKADLQHSHIPIIMLTAKNTLGSKIEGLDVGADAYIEKPFSMEHLQAQISNLIASREKLKNYFASSPMTHIKGIACSKPDQQFLERLYQVINENIINDELDVELLSVLMNMSRPTLYRKIKALSNLSPGELIILTRLKKAAEFLAEGFKVSEVADMVGYTHQNNFSRDFHKQFGLTPTNYVNSLQHI